MRSTKWIVYAAFALIVISALSVSAWAWNPLSAFYRVWGVGVASFTPSGEVASSDVVVRITFSGPVTPTAGASLDGCVQMEPRLPGGVRLENGRTLVFVPSAPLAPSTRYKVLLTGYGLKPAGGGLLQKSDAQTFNSPLFKVKAARLFYLMDAFGEREDQLMGELDFNYPVSADALRPALNLSKDGHPVDFQLEASRNPTRFYLRAGKVQRGDKAQTYKLDVAQGLLCIHCGVGLEQADTETIELPAKPLFTLDKVSTHPMPGRTLVGLQFSLPISKAQLQAHLSVEPAIPFSIETEHTYAILRGDFQPNVTYQIVLSPGIRCEDGQKLSGPAPRKDGDWAWPLTIQDLPASVRFTDRGDTLSLKGPLNIAVKTVNLDKFTYTVSKVYRNNLVRYLRGGDAFTEVGRVIGATDVTVQGGQINEEVETDLNLRKANKEPYRGLYEVSLEAEGAQQGQDWDDSNWANDNWDPMADLSPQDRVFLITDLGLVAKVTAGDLWVRVISTSSLKALANVRVDLVSGTNQVMQSRVSGADGGVHFGGLGRQGGEQFTPFVVVAEKGDDFSYLRLDRNPLPTGAFDVGGDPYTSTGLEAFLSSDRGLYRPGETAHLTAILRRDDLAKAPELPLTLTLQRDGNELTHLVTKPDAQGMAVFDWPIPSDLATGDVNAVLSLDKDHVLSTNTLKVEEFIPDKIRARVESGAAIAVAGLPLSLTVSAEELFGGPAAGLKVQAQVSWQARLFEPAGWDGFHFSDDARDFSVETDSLPDGSTDAKGKVVYPLMVPDSLQPPSMLQAVVVADVFDSGGRPVGAGTEFLAHVYPYYLGLKLAAGQRARANQALRLDLAAVLPTGKGFTTGKVPLAVKRRVWYSLFDQKGMHWSGWDSQYYDEDVLNTTVDIRDGHGFYTFTPDKAGDYTVVVGGVEGHRASLTLGVTADATDRNPAGQDLENPERLGLGLDKAAYKPGQMAQVRVRAPFPGRLLLDVEREGVLWQSSMSVPAGLSVHAVPVPLSAAPNVYVAGLLLRRGDENLRDLPVASFGVLPLPVDCGDRKIKAAFTLPASVRSRESIRGSLALGQRAAGASVVVAAVDEGILQIINFASPDPFTWFYRKRSLDVSTLCGFSDLLPDLKRKEAVGGDEDESYARRHLNPVEAKRVIPMVWFSGRLKAGPDGIVRFKVPTRGFHGQIRFMAVAAKDKRFGAASKDVKVDDPLIVETSLPRFLAPGDDFELPVTLFNRSGKRQKITVSARLSGPIAPDGPSRTDLVLDDGEQTLVSFHVRALNDAGKAVIRTVASCALGDFDDETELAVRPGSPLKTVVATGRLKPGDKTTLKVPGGFIRYGAKARLTVGSSPLLLYLRSLDYLVSYPYGCGEQLTSKAFPLLYFKDMGLLTGRYSDRAGAVEQDVQASIDQLAQLQTADGGFAYWPGEQDSDEWLSDYATDFLLEAGRKGYTVPKKMRDAALKRLGALRVSAPQGPRGRLDRRLDNTDASDVDGSERPYAFYIKALAGVPELQGMRAFVDADRKTQDIEDRCLVSLAYSAIGDRATARRLLPDAGFAWKLVHLLGGNLDSPNRETAMLLLALTQCDPEDQRVPSLVEVLGGRVKDGHFGSTQEDSWAFRALGAALGSASGLAPVRAQWGLENGPMKSLSNGASTVSDPSLGGKTLVLHNEGQSPLYYYLMAEGTPLQEEPGRENGGIRARRVYLDDQGKPLNLESVGQGQLVVVRLEIDLTQPVDNLAIVDLLPAGLEVENPRLSSRGGINFDPGDSFTPENADYRDDRVLLFTGEASGSLRFSYACRAVTPGRFKVPGLLVEAMYNPDIYSRTTPDTDLIVARNRP